MCMRPTTTNLALLRQLRDHKQRLFDLELADLDRQIKAATDGSGQRPKRPVRTPEMREADRTMLRVIQEASEPMRTADIIARLGAPRPTVTCWLAAMVERGHLERVSRGRYRVAKEVPKL
jgi:predicted Rossmann fold nucleotide-binding protein DprA/Smf involved in DNA uptake